jgi:hypothetical protein
MTWHCMQKLILIPIYDDVHSTKFPGKDMCTKTTDCLDPSLKPNQTFLEVYNCNNEKPPRKVTQPAEKVVSTTISIKSRDSHLCKYDSVLTKE